MDIYLHHYPTSPFSEKVRLILGYLGLPWHSVVIPTIMPRPLLMPLSGGYRKTPCLQIGANVFCDSAAIARGLVRHSGDGALFAPGFAAHRVAAWADSQLFRVIVTLNFAPEAVGAMLSQISPEDAAAFAKDRAELTAGSPLQTVSVAAARAELLQSLHQLEASPTSPFLFGDAPSIADFSVYQCLWFLRNSPVNASLLAPFGTVAEWMARIEAFGHGDVTESTGEAALAYAKASEPALPDLPTALPPGVSIGDSVQVTPTDYGRIAVDGKLVACGFDEVVLEREAPEVGRVMTHFPMAGFEITR